MPQMDYTSAMSFVRWKLFASCQACRVLIWSIGFPDPFAVATVGGEQTKTTGVIKKTLNPYWNESFDMYVEWRQHVETLYADSPPGV